MRTADRSTFAFTQSDQSLRLRLNNALDSELSIDHTAKTLTRLRRCAGLSESSQCVDVNYRNCCAPAHIVDLFAATPPLCNT